MEYGVAHFRNGGRNHNRLDAGLIERILTNQGNALGNYKILKVSVVGKCVVANRNNGFGNDIFGKIGSRAYKVNGLLVDVVNNAEFVNKDIRVILREYDLHGNAGLLNDIRIQVGKPSKLKRLGKYNSGKLGVVRERRVGEVCRQSLGENDLFKVRQIVERRSNRSYLCLGMSSAK